MNAHLAKGTPVSNYKVGTVGSEGLASKREKVGGKGQKKGCENNVFETEKGTKKPPQSPKPSPK